MAADDIGGIHHQRVKVQHGADGSATDVSSASPMPVIAAANSGVDIGDTDVTSLIPGTGATNLGKAIDSVAGVTDTGVGLLAVVATDVTGALAGAAGDWSAPNMDSKGRLRVSPGGQHAFDAFVVTTGWTVFNNDTLNLATTLNHVTLTGALSFDKVNGAGNTTLAGIQKTISSVSLNNVATGALFFQALLNIPDATNTQFVVIRLGTDNTNYNEWKIPATSADISAGVWEVYRVILGASTGSTGNGWNLSAVTWIFVGVEFATETDTLAAILVDSLTATGGQINSSDSASEISSSVTSANINLQKIGGSVVDKGAGNASNGSQRVVIASDDINAAAIKTAVELIDNAVSGAGFNITQLGGAAVPIGAGTEAAAIRVTLPTNGTGLLTVGGNVAHDAADSGNPLKVGAKAKAFDSTAPGTDVAEDDRVDMIATVEGRQFVETTHPNYWRAVNTAGAAQTNITVKAAPGAGLKLYVTDVIISNGATAGEITLLDGSGGTVLVANLAAINGGLTHSFRTPLALTANTLLAVTSTTVTTHRIAVSGFIAA